MHNQNKTWTMWLTIVCVAVLTASMPTTLEAATVSMLESAIVESDQIRLGEISVISGDTNAMRRRLKELVVGKAPLPGRIRQISDEHVRIKLRQKGIDPSNVDIVNHETVAVSRSGIDVSEKKLKIIAGDYVLNNVKRRDAKIRLKSVRVGRSVTLPKGRVTYRVVPPTNSHLSSSISLAIIFKVDGEFADRIPVLVKIEVLKAVAVARFPFGRNQVVGPEDIELKMMDVSNLPSGIITSLEDVVGMRTRRTININAVLQQNQFEMPPLVRKGDIVLIIAESGGLRVTAHGEVKGKGQKGDTVRVVNLDSKKGIYAEVVDEGTVRVEF